MINLLSTDSQKYFRAARLNLQLRTYIFVLLGVLFLVVMIFGGGYYLTIRERATANEELKLRQQETSAYQGVRDQANDFANNLKTAKTILSQETLYSDLITQIAKTLPSSATLTSLTLDATSFQKPVTLSARVKTKADALILKNTLETSSLFENVSLSNVTEEPAASGSSAPTNPITRDFPVTVTLNAQISKATVIAKNP